VATCFLVPREPEAVKHFFGTLIVALTATLTLAQSAGAATMSLISNPTGFNSPVTFTNNFETGAPSTPPANLPPFTFEVSSQLGLASLWTASVTSSGAQGLVEPVKTTPLPLKFVFATPVREVGMFFGNDDFGRIFNARLELFDAANVSLGSVLVRSNGNDKADQYIGVRSSAAAKSASISYDQPNAQLLTVYIDDLKVGLIPEPASAGLALWAWFGLALVAHRARGSR
jgi:hypothetical protein